MNTPDNSFPKGVDGVLSAAAPPRKADRWHYAGLAVAALLTLALHALFLLCTGYNPSASPPGAGRRGPECLLMPAQRTTSPQARQLHLFARIFRPTALILPNTEHGFSAVRTNPRPSPRRSIPVFSPEYTFTAERPASSFPLVPEDMNKRNALRNSWPLPLPPPPAVPSPGTLPNNALWHTTAGQRIDELPSIPRAEVVELATDTTPGRPTRLEIQRLASGLRIRVRSSSGNTHLDRLAVNTLRRALRPLLLAGDALINAPIPEVLVPDGNRVVRLRADWPLLLSTPSEQPANNETAGDEVAP